MKEKTSRLAFITIFILFIASLTWAIISNYEKISIKKIAPEQAKIATEKFVNENLMPDGSSVTIDEITEENSLYKININLDNGQIVESYLTLDGKIFFPQGFSMLKEEKKETPPVVADNIIKSDIPKIELFVMSHCPFGLQMEKGILPVINTLKDKIDFELKFVDYSMHGEKELNEELQQYCIQKTSPEKLNSYLSCFLGSGDSDACLANVNLDKTKNDLKNCIAETDEEYKITYNFKNNLNFSGQFPGINIYKEDNTKYNIAGSPSLIINESEVNSKRNPAALLATVCAAFNEAPEECKTELSSAPPSSGFGYGKGNDSGADCN
jgi:hypothetical protein